MLGITRCAILVFGLACLAACGNDAVGTEGDVVGGACTDGDCAGGSVCLIDTMHPGGMCSVECTSNADCPSGSACAQEGGGRCLLACDNADDCRDGYGCNEKSTLPDGSALVCIL